jgi:hypothetical protein
MRIIAIAVACLVLVGCATPNAEPTADANAEACEAFEAATVTWLNVLTGEGNGDWDDELAKIDAIGLRADGQVQERILTLLDEVPSVGDVFVYPDARDTVNDLINSVARACDAEGAPITPNQFTN